MPSPPGGIIDLAMSFERLLRAARGVVLGGGAAVVAYLVFALIGAAAVAEVAAALVAVVAIVSFAWAYS